MKKVQLFGQKLNREELLSISGGNQFSSGNGCVVKSCRTTKDCGGFKDCNCYRNTPGSFWGYCQKRTQNPKN